MQFFRWLGFSIALALTSSAAQASEERGPPATAQSADDPDAIDSLLSAPEALPEPYGSGVAPIDPIGDRIAVATHQIETKEYADAEALLVDLVAEQERRTSRYDASLVIPLTLLGDALNGVDKHKEALRAYEQAQHITRITGGLHTVEQVGIVYKEANALASMGQIDKANDRQEYAYEILARKYGSFGPGLVPGLYHLAAWYDRTSNIFAARGLYERAIQILVRANGDTDPSLIPALHGLANTYRDERFPPYQPVEDRPPSGSMSSGAFPTQGEPGMVVNRFGPGELAYVEIIKIVSADPSATPLAVAKAELDLADWYLLFDKEERAIPVYVHARQIMRERAAMTDEQIATYFGQPVVLYRPIPDSPPLPPPALRSHPTEGFVEVGYTVTAQGEVGDLVTLAAQPEGMMDMKVRRGMRVARFRPRFDGDAPVASPNQIYRHTFLYHPQTEAPATTAEHPDPDPIAQPAG